MVEWTLRTRRTRDPGGDPCGVMVVSFDDGDVLELWPRPEVAACQPWRRTYGYRITSRAGATVAAAELRSGVGEDIDLVRALAALTSFLLADAERYDNADRGEHLGGGPVAGEHEWASQHASDLEALDLELSELPPRAVPAARLAPPGPPARHDQATSTGGQAPYRIAMVSVRSDRYVIAGGGGCFDLDQPPPAHLGDAYHSIEQAKTVAGQDLAGVTAVWQVRILDATGATVAVGCRAGPNGTGDTIRWNP